MSFSLLSDLQFELISHLVSLKVLSLKNVPLVHIDSALYKYFPSLDVEADFPGLCCMAMMGKCSTPHGLDKQYLCDHLILNIHSQVILWIFGCGIVLDGIALLITFKKKVKGKFVIIQLHFSEMLIGFNLIILGIVHHFLPHVHALSKLVWRRSSLCKII